MPTVTSSDEYLISLTRVRRAAAELHAALAELEPYCDNFRADIEGGRDLVDVIKDAKRKGVDDCRRRIHTAIRQFEHELQCVRGQSFLTLVDRGGMTITEAARLSAVSPQMARRLYRAVEQCEKTLD